MTDAIVNTSDLMDGVREKIKATILESIPAEKWQVLIEHELKNFFEPCQADRWGHGASDSPFRKIVNDELRTHVIALLKCELKKQEWQRTWDGLVGDRLRAVLVTAAPEMIAQWFASLASQQIMVWANSTR
jgi:hypothetical protein